MTPQSVSGFYKDIVLRMKVLYSVDEAHAMADRLFEHYLNLSPSQRVLTGSEPVPDDKLNSIELSVSELLKQLPLQYVTGTAYFMDMEFLVNPSVLIPRPETEEMVCLILNQFSPKTGDQPLQILDIGTGSGCIAISLKRNMPGSIVTAVDISLPAIETATANAKQNEVVIDFAGIDILDRNQWEKLPVFDLIVSNPPYVTHSEKQLMQPNVLDNEPHTALFVPDDDPLLFYREITMLAMFKLAKSGSVWFEINEAFGEEVLALFDPDFYSEKRLINDMSGKHRFVMAKKK